MIKINILFIAHEGDLNGASLSLLGIIDNIKEQHTVHVLTCSKNGAFNLELEKRNIKYKFFHSWRWMCANNCGKSKFAIKKAVYKAGNKLSNLLLWQIGAYIKENKIDIIHSNSSVVNIGAIIAEKYNIKHLWHIREFGKEDFSMEFIYSEKQCLEFMNNNSDKVVFVSKAVENKYKDIFPKTKRKVIYNGVSEDYIIEKTFSNRDTLNILIAGRIEEAKGQWDAVKAIKNLVDTGKDNIKLYIAGEGAGKGAGKGLVEEIKDFIKENNLQENIFLCGRCKDMNFIREKMDIELVCSRSEAFGRVTIEAMMAMSPVIGANAGGTLELIKDNKTGFIYEKDNYVDLANKINIFYEDKSLLKSMGQEAFKFAKGFTAKKNAEEIVKVYGELVMSK